ncbi:TlpA disulfide reductase family protein [Flavobacteriaceae bacterium SZ-1-7]|uniref:TlpA family protein disulfide reductase n=1 Tax=Tamlana sedimenti TaxID=3134126 RepID=UPI00312523E2
MKKLLIVACAVALMNCKENPKSGYAIISGKISNKTPNELSINSYDQSFKEVLAVSPDGTFSDTLSTKRSNYVLFDGKNPVFLYVEPGFNLNINYNAQDFPNTLNITGNGAEISNYLSEKRKEEQELLGNLRTIYALDEAEYLDKLNSFKAKQESLLHNAKNIPENFIKKEERNIHYNYLRMLGVYEMAHIQLAQDANFRVSEDFLKELNDIDYSNEEDFEFSHHYKALVSEYYKKRADNLSKTESMPFDLALLKTLGEIPNKAIKNGLLFDFANFNLVKSENVKEFYKLYTEYSTDDENNKLIADKYKKLTAIEIGKVSPKFVNYKNHKGGTTSLDDLKGKYVYIDVWATWCGPCVREIPALKKVEAQYHDKNIEFVSISIDKASDFTKWQNMVTDRELQGIQLFADNDWNSSFVKDYGINGIPRFILLDPNGNIVNPDAPRPSDPNLVKVLSELGV